jgi:hypothetical protein
MLSAVRTRPNTVTNAAVGASGDCQKPDRTPNAVEVDRIPAIGCPAVPSITKLELLLLPPPSDITLCCRVKLALEDI